MTRTTRRPLLSLALGAALALAPAFPALAAPADAPAAAWSGFAAWLEGLARTVFAWGASEGETYPFIDPNGVHAATRDDAGDSFPYLDPNGVTAASGAQETPPDGGESYPFLDPDGAAQEAPPDGGGETYPYLDPDG